MEIIGYILWYLIPVSPFVTIPLIWKYSKKDKMVKFILGLGLAYIISFLFYHFSVTFCFENGTGPGF